MAMNQGKKNDEARKVRVLVFNFLGQVIDRGIPLYARDIVECLRRAGYVAIELRCPRIFRLVPRGLRNLLFVIFEQIVAPAMRVATRCSLTVYPYNSVGVIDVALGRSVLVVHDLISNDRRNRRPAARYIRWTQSWQRTLGGPICAASDMTLTHLQRLKAFRRCSLHLWSNPFYTFEGAVAEHDGESPERRADGIDVLLCTGISRNKDYAGALKLFTESERLRNARLRVIGFGDDAHLARRRVAKLPPEVRERITVLPNLSLFDAVSEYLSCDLVWVHSHKEGFGRSVVEGRLCRRPVIASTISAFVKHADCPGVRLYRHTTFDADVDAALAMTTASWHVDVDAYHARLEASVREVVTSLIQAAAPIHACKRRTEY